MDVRARARVQVLPVFWKVPNFRKYGDIFNVHEGKNSSLISSPLIIGHYTKSKGPFKLLLQLKFSGERDAYFVDLRICSMQSVYSQLTISIINGGDDVTLRFLRGGSRSFKVYEKLFGDYSDYGVDSNGIIKNIPFEKLPNDTLILNGNIFLDTGEDNLIISDNPLMKKKINIPQTSSLNFGFKSKFDNENCSDFSDIKIVFGDEIFSGHKVIFAAQSSVFSAMFRNENFSEATSGVVNISDFETDTVKAMIKYMYTNETGFEDGGDVNNIADLAKIADKYDLIELKKVTEIQLINKIISTNLVDLCGLVDLLNLENLKKSIIAYIVKNFQVIKKQEVWLQLFKFPEIITIVMAKKLDVAYPLE